MGESVKTPVTLPGHDTRIEERPAVTLDKTKDVTEKRNGPRNRNRLTPCALRFLRNDIPFDATTL